MEAAALAVVAGLDPRLILECRDPVELLVWNVVLKRATKIQDEMRKDLANRIANALAGD